MENDHFEQQEEHPVKVWLLKDSYICRPMKSDSILLPAGTCLFIAERQTLTHKHLIWIYGHGTFDCIPLSWLTLEAPKETPELVI